MRPRSQTVLVADDEIHLHRVIAEVLALSGYAVLGAESPREALLIGGVHQGPIDLLLTDVVMPEMSGFGLADRLQAARPGLRVLYMSGYVDRDAIRYRIQEGGTALLMKPFTPEVLVRRVREVLEMPAPAAALHTDLAHSRGVTEAGPRGSASLSGLGPLVGREKRRLCRRPKAS